MSVYTLSEIVDFLVKNTWTDPCWKFIQPDDNYRHNIMTSYYTQSVEWILKNGGLYFSRDSSMHLQCLFAFLHPSEMSGGIPAHLKQFGSFLRAAPFSGSPHRLARFTRDLETIIKENRQPLDALLYFFVVSDVNIHTDSLMQVIFPLTQYENFCAVLTDTFTLDFLKDKLNFRSLVGVQGESTNIMFYVSRRNGYFKVPRPVIPAPMIKPNSRAIPFSRSESMLLNNLRFEEGEKNPKQEMLKYIGKQPLKLNRKLEELQEESLNPSLAINLKFMTEEVTLWYIHQNNLLKFGSYGFVFLQYVTHIDANRERKLITLTYGDRPFTFTTDSPDVYDPLLRGLVSEVKRLKRNNNTNEVILSLLNQTELDQSKAASILRYLFPLQREQFIEDCKFQEYFNKFAYSFHNHVKISRSDFVDLIRTIKFIQLETIWKTYSSDGKMTEEQFQNFLQIEQKEKESLKYTKKIMSRIIGNGLSINYFTEYTFAEYLASKLNDAFNYRQYGFVYQEMDKPISYYYVSSSHNTYIESTQINGEASVEMYSRILRLGCRCIEIDTWNGTLNNPDVTHGNANMKPVKLIHVLKCIRDNAFVTSPYPIIISLENHCDEVQRKVMAQQFTEVFGDMLLLPPSDKSAPLPSPAKLKRKILLKGRTFGEGAEPLDTILYIVSARDPKGSYQMTSYVEDAIPGLELAGTINRTQNQLIRVFPAPRRVDSSNFFPTYWNKGIQLLALNYQTFDDPMIINLGKFKDNGNSGYLLKPNPLLSLLEPSNSGVNIWIINLIEARLNVNRSPSISIKLFRPSAEPPLENIIENQKRKYQYWKIQWNNFLFPIKNEDETILLILFDFVAKGNQPAFRLYCSYPVKCLREGFRIFPLSREGLEVSGCFLLTHITNKLLSPDENTKPPT